MELWDLYTKDREKTGLTMVRGEAQPEGYYRLAVHACIFNDKDEMLIQHRQPFKKGWSDMWDVSMGGGAVYGDTSRTAVRRELMEELGIEICFDEIQPALTINFEYGFDDFYLIQKNVELDSLKLQQEEVSEVRWAGLGEILQMIEDGIFIPYHKSFLELLFYMGKHHDTLTAKDHTGKRG